MNLSHPNTPSTASSRTINNKKKRNVVIVNSLSMCLLALSMSVSFAKGADVNDGSIVTLKNGWTGHCLAVPSTSSGGGGGAKAQGQPCDESSSFQKWKVMAAADGTYQLMNVGSGFCLADPSSSTAVGTVMQQRQCGTRTWQEWQLTGTANGYFSITSAASSLYLDEDPSNSAVHQWSFTGGTNQQWLAKASSQKGGPIGFGAGTTGGQGGAVVTVADWRALASALCATSSNGVCTDSTPRIIRVEGMIDFRGTEGRKTQLGCTYSSSQTSPTGKLDKILAVLGYCNGRKTYNITFDAAGTTPLLVGSNKTLIGLGANSGLVGKGVMITGGVSNVIVRNLTISDINDGVIWAGDAITVTNASKVWIDHNYIARIGRQMIVTGWDTAQNVTISGNYFDGTSDYGYWGNGKSYWTLLLNAANQTITLAGNRFHNTGGRGPETGKPPLAASTGVIHIVNNYYDSTEYFSGGLSGTNVVSILLEGNYYAKGDYFFPIMDTTPNKTDLNSNWNFAPIDGNIERANKTCLAVLGRACVSNADLNGRASDFLLNPAVMSNIQKEHSAAQAIQSVIPGDPSSVPNGTFGPQANIQ